MSHSENKVNWCLRKAENEIKEGKKHRGLVITDSDLDESTNICAAGIHFFAFYGYSGNYIFSLFPELYQENFIYILMTWHLKIITKYISIDNIIQVTNGSRNPLIISNAIKEYKNECYIMKKLL